MPAPPSTRPRISREFLEEHRRRRYVDAAAELLHEFGRHGLSVANIVQLAGSARNSFYEVFTGVEDCIAYGIGVASEQLFATLEAQDGEGEWLAEVHDSIAGFYGAVAAEPILAELFLVHSAASQVDQARAAARAGAECFAPMLWRGRAEAEAQGRRPPAALADEYLSRVIVSLAARRVRGEEVGELPGESKRIARLVGAYYLGAEESAGILTHPPSELVRS